MMLIIKLLQGGEMKKLLLFLCCSGTMLMTSPSHAAFLCNLSGCSTTLNGDAGHTQKKCTAVGGLDGCACLKARTGYCANYTTSGSCVSPYTQYDTTLAGQKCCVSNNPGECAPTPIDEPTPSDEVTTATTDEGLADIFDSQRTTEYYGYVDGVVRSPNNGRTTSAMARLDACLHYVDVDAITGADNSEKWTNCYGSQGCGTTIKNEYCRATGTNNGTSMADAVCKDRCDCVFGFGTCESL
jgi:hypothetical protein